MMQNAILKKNWPLLEIINLNKKYKIKDNSNLFYFLLNQLESFLIKNDKFNTLEVLSSELSRDIFIKHFPVGISENIFTAYRSDMSLVSDSFTPQLKLNPNKIILTVTEHNKKNILSETSFDSDSLLMSHFLEMNYKFPLVIIENSVINFKFIEKIIEKCNVYYLLLLANNSGLFSSGDNSLRDLFEKKGLIFKSRINGRDDFFVASDAMNGFPKELFETISTNKLQKLISMPPGGDFTTFK